LVCTKEPVLEQRRHAMDARQRYVGRNRIRHHGFDDCPLAVSGRSARARNRTSAPGFCPLAAAYDGLSHDGRPSRPALRAG
jgi:hypothetical protein